MGEAYENANWQRAWWNFVASPEICLMIWIWNTRWRFLRGKGGLGGRYRRTHVYSDAVIHFTFKLRPQLLLVMRHAACVRCKGALSFHIAKWVFFSSMLAFSPFTQVFGVRVQLPLYKQCRQQLVVLPLLPLQKKGGGVDIWPFIGSSAKCIRVDPRNIAFLANAVSRTGWSG